MVDRLDARDLAFVNSWLRNQGLPEFDERCSGNGIGLSVMFRKLGEPGDTVHAKNHYATALTSWPWEKPPFSNNAHCEVLLELRQGCVVRLGTVYQREMTDPVTKKKSYIPGKLFIIPINDYSHYDAIRFECNRAAQLHVLRTAIMNHGAPFNVRGYYMKALFPWAVGVGSYDPEAHSHDNFQPGCPPLGETHCTQLVVILLQAAAHSMLAQGSFTFPREHWASKIMCDHAPSCTPNYMFKRFYNTKACRYQPSLRSHGQQLQFSIDF